MGVCPLLPLPLAEGCSGCELQMLPHLLPPGPSVKSSWWTRTGQRESSAVDRAPTAPVMILELTDGAFSSILPS